MSDSHTLLSRVLLSVVFIVSGAYKFADVSKILASEGTKRFFDMVAPGMAPPTALGYVIAAIELFGGLALLLGIQTRLAAWLLILWTIIATYLGHAYSLHEITTPGANQINFMKNLAIIGGLLLLTQAGAGRHSVDRAMSKSE
jgi:putative oxidoreductase